MISISAADDLLSKLLAQIKIGPPSCPELYSFLVTEETFTTVKWQNQEFLTAIIIYCIEAKHGK